MPKTVASLHAGRLLPSFVLTVFPEDVFLCVVSLACVLDQFAHCLFQILLGTLFEMQGLFPATDGWQFKLAKSEGYFILFFAYTLFLAIYVILQKLHFFTLLVLIYVQQGLFCLLLNCLGGLFLFSLFSLEVSDSLFGLLGDLGECCSDAYQFHFAVIVPGTEEIIMRCFWVYFLHKIINIYVIRLIVIPLCKDLVSRITSQLIYSRDQLYWTYCKGNILWMGNKQIIQIYLQTEIIMKAKLLVAIALLLPALLAIKLKVSVDRNEGPVCFYENMQKDQKYLFKVEADSPNFRMDVMTQDSHNTGWKDVATRMAKRITESINKITQQSGTYTFCISSAEERTVRATVEIQTKLQLANFDYLPNLDDNQNLNREIDWMVKQKEKMFEIINRMEGMRSSSEQVKSMMGVTMIVLAILGVVGVAAVNVMFYALAKKTLKERKLI